MPAVSRIGDSMKGNVSHHANHIIGYTGGEFPQPIYCSGHVVSGGQTSGVSKFVVGGSPVATVGKSGSTNCACDGQGYQNKSGQGKFMVGGSPIVRVGDSVNVHNHGSGSMTSGLGKFIVR